MGLPPIRSKVPEGEIQPFLEREAVPLLKALRENIVGLEANLATTTGIATSAYALASTAAQVSYDTVALGNVGALAGRSSAGDFTIAYPARPTIGSNAWLVVAIATQHSGVPTKVTLQNNSAPSAHSEMPVPRVATAHGTVGVGIYALPEALVGPTNSVGYSVYVTCADGACGRAFWVTGVDQNRSLGSDGTITATSSTTTLTQASVTTTRPGAMVIDFVANDDQTDMATPGTGQTEFVDGSDGGATISMQASYQSIATPQSVTHTWSDMTNAAVKRGLALVFEPAILLT